MDFFTEKTAIVTGAASGIGRALSEALAQRGAIVILADVNAELLEETKTAIEEKGYKAESAVLDVTDYDNVLNLINQVITKHSRLDYLFNNAGIAVFAEARDYAYNEDWRRIIDVDLYGPVNGVAVAFPKMI